MNTDAAPVVEPVEQDKSPTARIFAPLLEELLAEYGRRFAAPGRAPRSPRALQWLAWISFAAWLGMSSRVTQEHRIAALSGACPPGRKPVAPKPTLSLFDGLVLDDGLLGVWVSLVKLGRGNVVLSCGLHTLRLQGCHVPATALPRAFDAGWGALPEMQDGLPGVRFLPPSALPAWARGSVPPPDGVPASHDDARFSRERDEHETESLVAEIDKRLSSNCASCGHSIADDHFHGECEVDNCDCSMPDIAEECEALLGLLKRARGMITPIQATSSHHGSCFVPGCDHEESEPPSEPSPTAPAEFPEAADVCSVCGTVRDFQCDCDCSPSLAFRPSTAGLPYEDLLTTDEREHLDRAAQALRDGDACEVKLGARGAEEGAAPWDKQYENADAWLGGMGCTLAKIRREDARGDRGIPVAFARDKQPGRWGKMPKAERAKCAGVLWLRSDCVVIQIGQVLS